MIYKYLPLLLLATFSSFISIPHKDVEVISTSTDPKTLAENAKANWVVKSQLVYSKIDTGYFSLPNFEAFSKAFEGFEQLKNQGIITNNILTIIDFSLPSTQDRLWVIDMNTQTVLFQSLVAHGKNSGDNFATHFSNVSESFQSSLGFYTTAEVYQGKHGFSLRLDGVEKGINDNARNRAIVLHGADYVSKKFITQHGRLGRSQGCPAVPYEIHEKLIETIKNKSCLFIYHPSRNYVVKSKLVS
ncbi:MAG: murein L,D-transpeptidase catalytic domain family protein [Flavobacterium sp.]|nr:murein L,D-transpeptidase catalytic domain family protein [Flavobacterium sp.]